MTICEVCVKMTDEEPFLKLCRLCNTTYRAIKRSEDDEFEDFSSMELLNYENNRLSGI